VAKITVGTPMWRNDGRNGLKIEIFAVSLPFFAHQFMSVSPGKLPKLVI
jgi:hypothetical protein